MPIYSHDGKTSYEGRVIELRERNYHDDSDFYAVVWDGEALREIEYDTTRFAGGGDARVDVTAEVMADVGEYARRRLIEIAEREASRDARALAVGRRVRVVRGRKVPKGTIGTIFWIGDPYSYTGYGPKTLRRVGIALSERKENGRYVDVAWTDASNCEVLNPEWYIGAPHWLKAIMRASDQRAYRSYRAAQKALHPLCYI